MEGYIGGADNQVRTVPRSERRGLAIIFTTISNVMKTFFFGLLQLPISIDEYLYFNLVRNRLPFGLEKGFLITATSEDKAADAWSGKVGHLAGQIVSCDGVSDERRAERVTVVRRNSK